jgi:hypothetical protein
MIKCTFLLIIGLGVLVFIACNNGATTTTTTTNTNTLTGTEPLKVQYEAKFGDVSNGGSNPHAIAADDNGNVYVAGYNGSTSANGFSNFCTIKYDSNGKQLWSMVYEGPEDGTNTARALALDNAGNAYVTGSSRGTGSGYDYATIKYDTSGKQLWAARYNGTGNGDDSANSVAIDSTGVYVTGSSSGTDSEQDFLTIKYDLNGNKIWEARYNSPENGDDFVQAMAIDKSGNVYIVGNSNSVQGAIGGSGYIPTMTPPPGKGKGYYTTLKYDNSGRQLWAAPYQGAGDNDDLARAIKVDDSGNIYVTGESSTTSESYAYATIKYDTNGKQLWAESYESPGGNSGAFAMALDTSGNILVTGYSAGNSVRVYATVKYDNNGNRLWATQYSGPYGDSMPCSVATDSAGNVYVTGVSGFIKYDSTADANYATVKYDKNGSQLWAVRYGGEKGSNNMAKALALDASGNIYVTGINYKDHEAQYSTIITIKYIQ